MSFFIPQVFIPTCCLLSSGMFGTHQTAVKRIVRQPQLEKHWRREHAILLRHHHPHLVRCYWTVSLIFVVAGKMLYSNRVNLTNAAFGVLLLYFYVQH